MTRVACGCGGSVGFCGGGRDSAELPSTSAHAIGVAFQGVDVGVVDEAVDHRGGYGLVAEDLAPASEGFVARDDDGCVFASVRGRWKKRFAASASKGM